MAGRKCSVVKCFSPVHKTTARSTICDKKVPRSAATRVTSSNIKKQHILEVIITLNKSKKMPSKSPSPPAVRQKMPWESFQRDKADPGTASTVISYKLSSRSKTETSSIFSKDCVSSCSDQFFGKGSLTSDFSKILLCMSSFHSIMMFLY